MPWNVFIDLSGQRFNRLTVLHRAENSKRNHVQFLCKCDCGKEVVVISANLKNGNTKSCGCFNTETRSKLNRSHGLGKPPEYNSWRAMKARCYNASNNRYKHYGTRGIIVCDRWLNSFENFLTDMGPKPGPAYTIDRIEVDGNYERTNCKWATKREQRLNVRK
jgi:hypothetical protein